MLQIVIPAEEQYKSQTREFIYGKEQILQLEHSLVSISKWESKWEKPFLLKGEKTFEETIDYIKCMTLTKNVDPSVYYRLTDEHIRQVNSYIEAPMTATTFSDDGKGKKGGSGEFVTSELIYYWMIEIGIPSDYEKWHLNRLLTLIQVCNLKRAPKKKMSKREIMERNRALNEARRKQFNSKG